MWRSRAGGGRDSAPGLVVRAKLPLIHARTTATILQYPASSLLVHPPDKVGGNDERRRHPRSSRQVEWRKPGRKGAAEMNAVELRQRFPREGAVTPPPIRRGEHRQPGGQADGVGGAVSTWCAEELPLPDQVDGADLAVVLALLDPGAVFVRERDGAGTSLMRRQ